MTITLPALSLARCIIPSPSRGTRGPYEDDARSLLAATMLITVGEDVSVGGLVKGLQDTKEKLLHDCSSLCSDLIVRASCDFVRRNSVNFNDLRLREPATFAAVLSLAVSSLDAYLRLVVWEQT